MRKYQLWFLVGFIYAHSLLAYQLYPGNWLLRGVMGASINVLREDTVTRETPGAGALLGVELEYMIDGAWSVTGAVRPVIAPGFVDLGFGAGAKYRWTQLGVPFIPYASVSITPAILIPVDTGKSHFNLGLRPTFGCDYFIMRDLSVGLEVALEPSVLFGSGYHKRFEVTVDMLAGATWRF